MKKLGLWAVLTKSGHLAFTSTDSRPLLFGLESEAKRHLQMMEDAVLVRVIVEPIKPKRARKRPSKWTARMGKPVYALPSTEWLQIAEPKPKRARGKK